MITATPAHADVLAAIHAAAFPAGEAWSAAAFAAQLARPGVFGLIGTAADGMLLAQAAAEDAEVLTLAVAGWARRRGLGRALLRAAMVQAAARGATAMFLEVADDNRAARALYAACGFAEVGRRRRYYPGGGDALVLRATLTRDAAAGG
ncbi:MAG: GNAT family N-acetyltransferase [Acidisphaera sp.]|nr:GNAT family N-acetyltransferase [Acidisphaera sp.]